MSSDYQCPHCGYGYDVDYPKLTTFESFQINCEICKQDFKVTPVPAVDYWVEKIKPEVGEDG